LNYWLWPLWLLPLGWKEIPIRVRRFFEGLLPIEGHAEVSGSGGVRLP
jgi:hypothetical protein